MENLGYLFAAYSVIWLVLFGYIFSIARRQQNLKRQLDILEGNSRED